MHEAQRTASHAPTLALVALALLLVQTDAWGQTTVLLNLDQPVAAPSSIAPTQSNAALPQPPSTESATAKAAAQSPAVSGPVASDAGAESKEPSSAEEAKSDVDALEQRIDEIEKQLKKSSADKKKSDAEKKSEKGDKGDKGDANPLDKFKEKWNVKLGGHVQMDYVNWANASPTIVGQQDYFEFRRLRWCGW